MFTIEENGRCLLHCAYHIKLFLYLSSFFLSFVSMFNGLHPALMSFVSDWHILYRICSSESDAQLTWFTDLSPVSWSRLWSAGCDSIDDLSEPLRLVSAPLIRFSALGLWFTGVPCSNVLVCFCPVWRAQEMLRICIDRLCPHILVL